MIDPAELAAIAAELDRLQRRLAAALGDAAADVAAAPVSSTTPPPAPIWVDTNAAARMLKCSYSTLYRYARSGLITGETGPTGLWRFDRHSVDALRQKRAA